MATDNTHENVVKFCYLVFEICERTDRQTDDETDIFMTILHTAPRAV